MMGGYVPFQMHQLFAPVQAKLAPVQTLFATFVLDMTVECVFPHVRPVAIWANVAPRRRPWKSGHG